MRRCPQCRSADVTLHLGGILGIKYQCKKCGYVGVLIIDESEGKTKKMIRRSLLTKPKP